MSLRAASRELRDPVFRSNGGEPDEVWVAEQKAGTILVALDGTSPRPWPCLMRVAGSARATRA